MAGLTRNCCLIMFIKYTKYPHCDQKLKCGYSRALAFSVVMAVVSPAVALVIPQYCDIAVVVRALDVGVENRK